MALNLTQELENHWSIQPQKQTTNKQQSKKNKDSFWLQDSMSVRVWYLVVVSIKRLNAYQMFTNKKG